MSLWDCAECGCRAIAPDLGFCPQCHQPKGEDMPKITSGGASNAWEPAPEGAAELPPPPPASAPKADHVEYVTAALGVPAEQAEAMTKAELTELTRPAPAEAAGSAPAASSPPPPRIPPGGAARPAESPSAPQGM